MVEILGIWFDRAWFFALIPLMLLCARYCKKKSTALLFSGTFLIQESMRKKTTLLLTLRWSILVLLALALASPFFKESYENKNKIGYDIALIIDTSGSMQQYGFNPRNPRQNKLEAIKEVAGEFSANRTNDNVALVVFGDFAYIAAPLSFDKKILNEILYRVQIGIAGEKTAIYDALAIGVNALQKGEAKSKIAILLTDGENTAGTIPKNVALEMTKKGGVKVYTIGIGGARDFDKQALLSIAKESGGEFFTAQNSEVLQEVYKTIDTLEKSEIKSGETVKKEPLYQYPLFLCVLFLVFYIYLYNRSSL